MAEQTIVSRIQNRRGLKQDLPSPLRTGELGFATDTRQLYIGADNGETSDIFNKSVRYENVINAEALTESLANINIIRFTVPHRRYERGSFDGVSKIFSWNVDDQQISTASSGDTVFKSDESEFGDLQQIGAFNTNSLTVVKNGETLIGDINGSDTSIASGRDYYFRSGTNREDAHQINFRIAPTRLDEIGIVYYNSQDVFAAISAIGDIGAGSEDEQDIDGFNQSIQSWRAIERKNIQISASTGVGFIGLSPKQTSIATDVLHTPSDVNANVAAGDLGNVFISRNDDRVALTRIDRSGTSPTNFSVYMSTSDKMVFEGRSYAYLSDVNSENSELNGKVFSIVNDTNSNNVELSVLPIPASTLRNVENLEVGSSSMTVTVENADNIEADDVLYFLDPPEDPTDSDDVGIANLNTKQATVTAVSGLIITTSLPSNVADPADGTNFMERPIRFVTRKDGGNQRNFVIYSKNHGFSSETPADHIRTVYSGNNFITSPNGGTVMDVTDDTFIITVNSASRTFANVAGAASFTIQPVFNDDTSATGNITPVYGADLSTANSLSSIAAIFNRPSTNMPFSLNFVPDTNNQFYITEGISSPGGFRIHDDSLRTSSDKLKIGAREYTRGNSTIKAKFETWLDSVRSGTNMISSLGINEEFSATSGATPTSTITASTWSLTTNALGDEIIFDSNEEARNFVDIINNIYYETENVDIKGLLNVKTNIEVLTVNNRESNSVDVYYDAPASINVTNGNNSYSSLGLDLDEVNTMFVEYSMEEQNSDTNVNYNRIGTLQISGDENADVALIQDLFTENKDGITSGNVTITASHSSGNVVVNINNTLQPVSDIKMAFIRKRWSI